MAFSDLDTQDLFRHMLDGARAEAAGAWQEVKGLLRVELRALARNIKDLGKAVAQGHVAEQSAVLVMRIHKNNLVALAATLTTIVHATAERIVNAALALVRDTVNRALGFALL